MRWQPRLRGLRVMVRCRYCVIACSVSGRVRADGAEDVDALSRMAEEDSSTVITAATATKESSKSICLASEISDPERAQEAEMQLVASLT